MNIPITLSQHSNILFLGIGGGFDIYTALPLLRHFVGKATFANYNNSATNLIKFSVGDKIEDYSPEGCLANWLKNNCTWCVRDNVYTLPKCGVKAMKQYLEVIIKENNIDCIVCVDGGVDSLMQGNEEGSGTFLEDAVTIIAANELNVKNKFLVCAGFGTETEEKLCHYSALSNIAELIKNDGFLGCCSLIKNTKEFIYYRNACESAWVSGGRKSHIQTKIISAVAGLFGDDNLYDGIDAKVGGEKVINFITPLMGIYWFFDLGEVVDQNKMTSFLKHTTTGTDVLMVYRQALGNYPVANIQPRTPLPL